MELEAKNNAISIHERALTDQKINSRHSNASDNSYTNIEALWGNFKVELNDSKAE